MTSNTHYYIPAGSPFPWKFGTSHYFLPISHLTFPSSYCVQNLIFFAFWGIGKSEKCPIKSTGTIDHLQCIVYRMWFYFTNNFKTFETSPKRKLLSHYQSNYVKWLVHIVELTCFNIASIRLTVVNIYGIFGCQWQSKKALHNSKNVIHS